MSNKGQTEEKANIISSSHVGLYRITWPYNKAAGVLSHSKHLLQYRISLRPIRLPYCGTIPSPIMSNAAQQGVVPFALLLLSKELPGPKNMRHCRLYFSNLPVRECSQSRKNTCSQR
jgi:hypothetical protein